MKVQVQLEIDVDENLWGLNDPEELHWFVTDVLANLKIFYADEDFLSDDIADLIWYRIGND